MTTYAFRTLSGDLYLSAPEFSRPTPVHAQVAAELRERERAGQTAALRRRMRGAELVTDVGNPAPYRGKLVPANALKVADAARAAGFEVRVIEYPDGCRVEGLHRERRVGFRADWVRGRTAGASWHTPYRYAVVRDDRPVKASAVSHTALKGYRPVGVGETRMQLLGRPQGMKINHTTLLERISK